MKHKISFSHVAVLVPSAEKAAKFLRQFQFDIGPTEDWDGEGTREIYVEKDKGSSLLLMEPIKAGAYQRALEKRGPGLHHIAIDVLDLEDYIHSLSGSGWLLHPTSVKTMKDVRTAYLARPGFPGLIEVQEKGKLSAKPLFVNEIFMELDPEHLRLLSHVGLDSMARSTTGDLKLSLGEHKIQLSDLL